MLFKDIIGQDVAKQHLVEMYNHRRVPHAMLFLGQEGCGALPLAIAFAQYINCTGDKSGGDSCGVCPSCVKYAKLVHPDLHFVFPTIKKKDGSGDSDAYIAEWREMFAHGNYFSLRAWLDHIGGEKQGIIAKSEASAIHRKLSLKPYEAERQVMVIWLPELMNETAANKILKILEEPPTDTIFMLVSENASEILPTVLSRTQRISVPPIDDDHMKQWLTSAMNIDPERADNVVHVAAGNFVKAKEIINNADENTRNLDFFANLMRKCYSRQVTQMMALSDQIQKEPRETVKNRLAYSLQMVRENFVMNLNYPNINYMTIEEDAFARNFSRFVHLGNVEQMSELFNNAIAQVEQNGNVRIIMMDLMLRLTVLIKTARP